MKSQVSTHDWNQRLIGTGYSMEVVTWLSQPYSIVSTRLSSFRCDVTVGTDLRNTLWGARPRISTLSAEGVLVEATMGVLWGKSHPSRLGGFGSIEASQCSGVWGKIFSRSRFFCFVAQWNAFSGKKICEAGNYRGFCKRIIGWMSPMAKILVGGLELLGPHIVGAYGRSHGKYWIKFCV